MNKRTIKSISKDFQKYINTREHGIPLTPENLVNVTEHIRTIVEKYELNLVDIKRPEFSRKTGKHNIVCTVEQDDLDLLADMDQGHFNEPERKNNGKTHFVIGLDYHIIAVN